MSADKLIDFAVQMEGEIIVWKLYLLGRGSVVKFPHQLTVACPVFTFFVISTGCFTAVPVLL